MVYQWVIFVDSMNSIPQSSRASRGGEQRIVPFSPCLLTLLLEKQHFAYLATSPVWNITPFQLVHPISSQKTQREEA
ncbi:hypothetical protein [Enterococcus casseliflavus]|uniref:hypothetical protein n=1 Tax=Enterococcus casseliflavus TaxID=37734 RepID=UPI0022E981AF|nr:hypothetical protein [Enterococcus casseliflavus]